ncbi:hypothetical protein KR222_005456 [Zaprionus bogoriensis]|nr:hypothetical protein KR222_005456 [Zaprionus bogoriensis]
MENSVADASSEKTSRKRVGRPPRATGTPQTTASAEVAAADTGEESLEALEGGDGTGSASPTSSLCRRSTRKKIVKFDVLDVLNKSRKSHKIQIEARIDSNAPAAQATATAAASTSASSMANRFMVSSRPSLPTVPPPLSSLQVFSKPKPMPSLIVAQVSSDKQTQAVKQQEPLQQQAARKRGRPRKQLSAEEALEIDDLQLDSDSSSPSFSLSVESKLDQHWESSDSEQSYTVTLEVDDSSNSSPGLQQQEHTQQAPTQIVLDEDSDSQIIFLDVVTEEEEEEQGEQQANSEATAEPQRSFALVFPKQQPAEQAEAAESESELIVEVLSESPSVWHTTEQEAEAAEALSERWYVEEEEEEQQQPLEDKQHLANSEAEEAAELLTEAVVATAEQQKLQSAVAEADKKLEMALKPVAAVPALGLETAAAALTKKTPEAEKKQKRAEQNDLTKPENKQQLESIQVARHAELSLQQESPKEKEVDTEISPQQESLKQKEVNTELSLQQESLKQKAVNTELLSRQETLEGKVVHTERSPQQETLKEKAVDTKRSPQQETPNEKAEKSELSLQESPATKPDSIAGKLPQQLEPEQVEASAAFSTTALAKPSELPTKHSEQSTVEHKKATSSPTPKPEKPAATAFVECDALFRVLDKADEQLRNEEKAKKKLKLHAKKQTTKPEPEPEPAPRASCSTPPARSSKKQTKKSSRRNTISDDRREEPTLPATNKRRNSLHPLKASDSPERQSEPESKSLAKKSQQTKAKPPRKAAAVAAKQQDVSVCEETSSTQSMPNTPTCEQLAPNPLQDIAKFIEDGVKLLERDYKLEDEKQQQTEAELAQRVANLETPAATPTPSPAVSTEDLSAGAVRRSHRIKQKPPSSSKSSTAQSVSRSHTPSISMEQQLAELATVESINEQFLRHEGLNTFQTLRDNYYRCARQVSKENAEMQCDCEEAVGQVPCGEGCINRMLMIECGPLCTHGDRCTNKRFQQHQGWPCRVFRTERKGCGITAELQIPPGEFIMEYVGEVIDSEEFERRQHLYSADRNRHYYFMALRGEAIIDATAKGNISRYINHSCDPNAETQKWTVNGELRIGFFSLKTIMPGEEITFDYQYQRYGRDAQRCYCESSNCRGWIGNEPESDEGEQLDTDSESEPESLGDEQQQQLELELEQEQEHKLKSARSNRSKLEAKLPTARRKHKEQHVRHKDREYKAGRWLRASGAGSTGEQSAKHDHIEDPDVLEQLRLLTRSGLKNQLDTLRFSRCMVRAKLLQSRLQLLGVLTRGELPCRRLFLDYHGLRLLHAWISEGGADTQLRLALLEALESLPIPNRTMLNDTRVYQCVQEWSTQCDNSDSDSELSSRILTLLQKWNGLPEIFRIPKRERIEQMKEHEREADRQQLEESNSAASSLLSSDRYKQDRFRRDTSSRYEKAKPVARMSGNNTICTITTQPAAAEGAKPESRRRGEYEPRRTISKELRRSLFERKVAQDEAEKRVGSEDWREHELRCEFFGADLNTAPKLLPFYQNTETNEWFNSEDMPVPVPQRCGDPAAPASPESVDEVEYKLPAGVEPLPPSWHWAMTPEGDIYYYNLRERIPQWEPPSAEQRLQQLVEDTPVLEPETDEAANELELVNIDIDCGSTLSAKSLAQYIEVKIRERRELRRNRLVSVRVISPRREEDRLYNQLESRKYKENKEKIRRRKEIYRRSRNEAGNPEQPADLDLPDDSLPIHRYLYSSDEEAAEDAPLQLDALLDNDMESSSRSGSSTDTESLQSAKRKLPPTEGQKKQRNEREKKRKTSTLGRDASAKFHFEISGHVAEFLRPYRQDTCQLGRITSDEDYKFLIKRLSHHITTKEMRYCDTTGNPLACTESVKHKSYDFIKQYMRKKGPVYKKPLDKAD